MARVGRRAGQGVRTDRAPVVGTSTQNVVVPLLDSGFVVYTPDVGTVVSLEVETIDSGFVVPEPAVGLTEEYWGPIQT